MKFIAPEDDRWQSLEPAGAVAAADAAWAALQPVSHRLLSNAQWQTLRARWPAGLPTGLLLDNTDDVEALAADLPRLALIVLTFPQWTDGRAYTQARLLRLRLRYAGELRASGAVLVDMLPLLQRTGFDSAQLRADQRLDAARRALGHFDGCSDGRFDGHYQGDARQPRPHFSRHAGAGRLLRSDHTAAVAA